MRGLFGYVFFMHTNNNGCTLQREHTRFENKIKYKSVCYLMFPTLIKYSAI